MTEIGVTQWLPWLDRHGRFSALRALAFALVLLPALLVAWDALTGQLGSKPWTRAVHDIGTWTIRLLLLTLAVSPLRKMFDWGKLLGIRRMLGVSVSVYAVAHLSLYCIDLAFDWGLIVSEIVRRVYLLVGITALIGLVALGVTSTDGMIKRMGAKNWQRLHDLVYPVTLLALLHFALQSKIDVTQPVLMTGLFALLMAYRGLYRFRLPVNAPVLAAVALATGLATALGETAWYAFATGASAWDVFQANADVIVYQDIGFLRPGHWIALVGLVVAAIRLVRAPRERHPRRERTREPARAGA